MESLNTLSKEFLSLISPFIVCSLYWDLELFSKVLIDFITFTELLIKESKITTSILFQATLPLCVNL